MIIQLFFNKKNKGLYSVFIFLICVLFLISPISAVSMPDLVITGLSGESQAFPGYPYQSNVTIENQGNQTSGITYITIFFEKQENPDDRFVLKTDTIDPIRAGSNRTIPIINTVGINTSSGFYQLYALIHETRVTSVSRIKEGNIARLATNIEIKEKALPNQTDLNNEIVSRIYNLTDDYRTREGLNVLEWDQNLADIADNYAKELGKTGYFSHTDKSGNGPKERAEAAGYPTTKAIDGGTRVGIGENLAYIGTGMVSGVGYVDPTNADAIAKAIMEGWIKSPGHRKNILDSYAERFGAGLFWNGEYYYAVQEFW
jgi:uncharacterized protein YkwD